MRSAGPPPSGTRADTSADLVDVLTAVMTDRLAEIDTPNTAELTIVSWMLSGELAAIRRECATDTSMALQPRILDVLLRERTRIRRPGRDLGAVARVVAAVGAREG